MANKITSIVAKEGNGNIQITFTIPFELIKESKDKALAEFAKEITVDGFRKGMAPIEKVEAKVSPSKVIEHTLSHLLPEALAEAITENKLQIAIYPRFELLSAKENEPWQVRGVTCELPKVTLGDYKKAVAGASRTNQIWTPEKGKDETKKELSAQDKENLVIKTLLDNVKVEIPQILMEEEADNRLSSLLARLEKLGLTLEGYMSSIGKKPEDLRADYLKQAKDAIAIDIILAEIAKVENIQIDPKQIENAISMSQVAQDPANDNQNTEDNKRLIESILKRREALDSLIKTI